MNLLRILYHHRTLADGAEGIHIEEMVRAFRDLGHEVRVVGVAATQEARGRGLVGRVKALLPQFLFELGSASLNLGEYLGTRRVIREFRPDFIYKRHARYDLGTILAARHLGVPVVVEVNCLFSDPAYQRFEPLVFRRFVQWFERRALLAASVVLAVSTPLSTRIRKLTSVEAVVVPNGVDPDRFAPCKGNGRAVRTRQGLGDTFVVGWAGVIREWHGVGLLLDALVEIAHARLLLVGDGPSRSATEARARLLGVNDRLCVTGRVPHAEMPDYIAAMDVCVVADERTGIACPMKLLEYMAMGRPVLAPSYDNIKDVVDDGTTGLLFHPQDAGELVRLLKRVSADPLFGRSLGDAARSNVLSHRNWRANAELVLDLVSGSRAV